jgi:UDP-N-acetylglucosamine/UDP-N-acetylgalactosamine diphosphorylase
MREEMVVGLSALAPVGRWGAVPLQQLLERMKDYGQEGAVCIKFCNTEDEHLAT